jgi:Reverse transcriptase (RNA-dependent DNA polymerase)
MRVTGVTAPDVVPSAGRGGGRGRGGRGGGGRGFAPRPFTPKKELFTGAADTELKGHVFDLSEGAQQAIQYEETLKRLKAYIGNKFDNGEDVVTSIENDFTPKEYGELEDLPANASMFATRKWNKKADLIALNEDKLEHNIQRLYAVVLAQCSESVVTKLQEQDEFEGVKAEKDGLQLLSLVRKVMQAYESSTYHPAQSRKAKFMLLGLRQTKGQDLRAYYDAFLTLWQVAKQVGVNLGPDNETMRMARAWVTPSRPRAAPDADEAAVRMAIAVAAAETNQAIREAALEVELAYHFIQGADGQKYKAFAEDLDNNFESGTDKFPKTVLEAYTRMSKYKNFAAERTGGTDAMAFTQFGDTEETEDADGTTLVTNGKGKGKAKADKSHIQCWDCGEHGHYLGNKVCTKPGQGLFLPEGMVHPNGGMQPTSPPAPAGTEAVQLCTCDATVFAAEGQSAKISKNVLLLDTQANVDVFVNPRLLTNIREAEHMLTISTTAGMTMTSLVGDFKGYGTVWYHPEGIANILSWSRVRRRFKLGYDSAKDEFYIYKLDGTVRTFTQKKGLYMSAPLLNDDEDGTALVSTVAANKSSYSDGDYSRAVLARQLQKTMGRPSTKAFIQMLEKKLLPNCPVTRQDVIAAEHIFGPDVGSLKGKAVRRAPQAPRTAPVPNLPLETMARYSKVELCADIMFINRIPFLVTVSRHIKFGTITKLGSTTAKTVEMTVKAALKIYGAGGFKVTVAHMDGEFEYLRGELASAGVFLNTASRGEHVGQIERYIRTIKERTRAIYNTLPFHRMPDRLIIEMVYTSVFWLNSFPGGSGISDSMSPREIVLRQGIDYAKHCRLEFGSYVQVLEEHDNSMMSRTTGALTLRPTGNAQGGHFFFSLTTGRVINRNQWTALPMPQDVVTRVNSMGGRGPAHLAFLDRFRQLIDDDQPERDDEDPIDDLLAGVYDDVENEGPEIDNPEQYNEGVNEAAEYEPEHGHEAEAAGLAEAEEAEPEADLAGELEPEIEIGQDEVEPEVEYRAHNDRYNLRHQRRVNYANMNVTAGEHESAQDRRSAPVQPDPIIEPNTRDNSGEEMDDSVLGFIFTQVSMKRGLKMFGDKGREAVEAELHQLHDRKVMEPVHAESLSPEEKKKALQYLMFLKEKRCGKIKGRGCADGRKQRLYTAKEEASSPTVAIESILLSAVIDAKEGRHVATADIPGAFMQADMDEVVHMRLEGTMVDLLLNVAPEYAIFVTIENGKKVLYVLLTKALYGTMRAALLFWRKLTAQLIEWGFKLNPYDPCVANKTIKGKQCTILWHVDDLKISHVEKAVVEEVLVRLGKVFGNEAPSP